MPLVDNLEHLEVVRSNVLAMQRGLGGFPHERLHQERLCFQGFLGRMEGKKTQAMQRRPAGVSPTRALHQEGKFS